MELWTSNKYTLDPSLAAAQDEKHTAARVGGKRKVRSDDDTNDTTNSVRKLMHALAASVTKMEQQFTMLLQRRDVDEYVKAEHGGPIPDTRDVVDLVDSTDDSCGSNNTLSEKATRASLPLHAQASKKVKREYTEGFFHVRSTDRPHSPRRKKSAGKSAKVATYTKRRQLRDCSYRNWVSGMKRNSNPEKIKAELAECTVDTLPEALAMMRKWGWAAIRNYDKILQRVPLGEDDDDFEKDAEATVVASGSVFSEGNAPMQYQADYPANGSFDGTFKKATPSETIFEGCCIHGSHYHLAPIKPSDLVCPDTGNVARQCLKPKSKSLEAYNEHYVGQMEDVIKGMFANEVNKFGRNPAANPANWHMCQSMVWGGIENQHQHCDQGMAGSFHYEQIFPFVCIHGFGVHEFNMWLLPHKRKREYGFPYRFPKKAMLFMRGDFIHAGGCSQATRAHMEFFPTREAGWTKTKTPYWADQKQFEKWCEKKNTFLIPDLRTYPFAFSEYSKEDANGYQNITYPCRDDDFDLFPQLKDFDLPRKQTQPTNTVIAEDMPRYRVSSRVQEKKMRSCIWGFTFNDTYAGHALLHVPPLACM